MATRIQVLSFEVKSVTSKKKDTAGTVYTTPEAQCVVHFDGAAPKVGVLNLPKDHPQVKPGFYAPTFKIAVGFDGKVFGTIDTLLPEKL
jgi:hypothetical protein